MNHITFQKTLKKLQMSKDDVADLIGFDPRTSRRYATDPKLDGSRRVPVGTGLLLQLMEDRIVTKRHIHAAKLRIQAADKRNGNGKA